jgi:hypothetical protein
MHNIAERSSIVPVRSRDRSLVINILKECVFEPLREMNLRKKKLRSSMAPGQCASASDRGSSATLVSHWMGDQNVLYRASPCFGRHVKPLVPAVFVDVSTYQPALGPSGGLWPLLLMCNL